MMWGISVGTRFDKRHLLDYRCLIRSVDRLADDFDDAAGACLIGAIHHHARSR